MIGDKLTADVAAGNRAALRRVAWLHRLGSQDLVWDRLIRRPLEDLLWYTYIQQKVGSRALRAATEQL